MTHTFEAIKHNRDGPITLSLRVVVVAVVYSSILRRCSEFIHAVNSKLAVSSITTRYQDATETTFNVRSNEYKR